jgi:hypothetical protein
MKNETKMIYEHVNDCITIMNNHLEKTPDSKVYSSMRLAFANVKLYIEMITGGDKHDAMPHN